MKLKMKFISISALSILVILIGFYTSVSTISTLQHDSKKARDHFEMLSNHTKLDNLSKNVRDSVMSYIAESTYNNQDQANKALSNLDGFINNYSEVIDACLKEVATDEIHQNYSDIKNLLGEYISKAKNIAASTNITDKKGLLLEFDNIFLKLDNIINTTNNLILELWDNTKGTLDQLDKHTLKTFVAVRIFTLIVILLLPLFTIVNIFNPQNELINVMHNILNGNDQQKVPFLDKQDELGDMAKALDKFRHSSIERKAFEEQAKANAIKAEEERRNNLLDFANNFEKTIKSIVDMVAAAATEMDVTAKSLESYSKSVQDETKQLSVASVQTNSNLQSVSKATNEFNASVNEISNQVTNSREYTHKASEQTDKVSAVVKELEGKTKAISGIIDIINNITSQIDLLALNAAIEAARAGEMGKGFAVVANEVKALATQTSKATEQINVQISGIQESSEKAVLSIAEITDSVKTINQNTASIASAVEEQNAISSYIADNLSKVVEMSNTVDSSVDKVAKSSIHSGNSAGQMVSASDDLLKQASILQKEVDKFLSSLRAV